MIEAGRLGVEQDAGFGLLPGYRERRDTRAKRFMSASGWPSTGRMVSQSIAVRGPLRCLGHMEREHGNIPLHELPGLADSMRSEGLEDREEIVRAIQEHFGLARLASTRQRFEL
ncbi:hypothetical protein [Bradyrhizobium sp. CCBAU 53415]|uniref:hypothetical protein n=1 Tax=Bradyrhizobium sp. CCBAU 53415 TaxID=1325119 RepID=UPI0023051332|nr:hypothetical protein [Bradyrhizobium sp. CCBAU 53415]